jgi:hypothetical protein
MVQRKASMKKIASFRQICIQPMDKTFAVMDMPGFNGPFEAM